jgi:hypothetical protein
MERLRPIALDDLKNATGDTYFVCVAQRTADGRFCRVRVNGKPKTWKTRPLEVSVPWKHGLYTFGYLTQQDIATGKWFVEVEVEK